MLAIHQVYQIKEVLEEDLELNLTPAELLACSVNVQAALSRDHGHTYAEMTNLGATGHSYLEVDKAVRFQDGWAIYRLESELMAMDREFRGDSHDEFCFSDFVEGLSL